MENNDIITIDKFTKIEKIHYTQLNKYFSECSDDTINLMIDIIEGNHKISLRILDWIITRYSKYNKTIINKDIYISISYKAQLKSYKKKYFDPFKRNSKFEYTFTVNNKKLITTIGQMNFFKWAFDNGLIQFSTENYDDIMKNKKIIDDFYDKKIIESNSIFSDCSSTCLSSNNKSDNYSVSNISVGKKLVIQI